jgi:hypothetical protein
VIGRPLWRILGGGALQPFMMPLRAVVDSRHAVVL